MNIDSIEDYSLELRRNLERTLSAEYVDEIVSEAKNHLSERAEELCLTGLAMAEAESQATREFGAVGEIAVELAAGYPPTAPIDPNRFVYLPEAVVSFMLILAAYGFSLYRGARGVESAAGMLLPSIPMLMIPGLSAGLSRLKYRRLRLLKVIVRLSNYGLFVCLLATAGLIAVQVSGGATLVGMYPMFYAFSAATILIYWTTWLSSRDSKFYVFVRERLRIK